MSALNKNNPNGGGTGDSSISKLVPKNVSVTSPDHKPANRALGGPKYLDGSPKGTEAKPNPQADGFEYS